MFASRKGQEVTENNGHCVWYGVCHRSQKFKSKIKNCAYDGPAKPLDASGVQKLSQWCPHLLPRNHTMGQHVNTCCDSNQVKSDQLTVLKSIINFFASR